MSIANCKGCESEMEEVIKYSKEGLHFAGEGLYERGHLFIRFVNNKGEIIVE